MIGTFKPAPASMNGPRVVKPAPTEKGLVSTVEIGKRINPERHAEIVATLEQKAKERRR